MVWLSCSGIQIAVVVPCKILLRKTTAAFIDSPPNCRPLLTVLVFVVIKNTYICVGVVIDLLLQALPMQLKLLVVLNTGFGSTWRSTPWSRWLIKVGGDCCYVKVKVLLLFTEPNTALI